MNKIIFAAETEMGIKKEFPTKDEAWQYAKTDKDIICICMYEQTEKELVMIDSYHV